MQILTEISGVSPGFSVTRSGSSVQIELSYGLSGYVDEETQLYIYQGDAYCELGSAYDYTSHSGASDRVMSLNFITGLTAGQVSTGQFTVRDYYYWAEIEQAFSLVLFDTAADHTGTDVMGIVFGSAEDDRINGGGARDFIEGGNGADMIAGGGDDDWIGGDEGNDTLAGDAGNDIMFGGGGRDQMAGGSGRDQLTGAGGSDSLSGGDGNDMLNGGWGFDRSIGGAGADAFFHLGVRGHGSDWIEDFASEDGDVLLFGVTSATGDDFQVNYATTPGAGADDVAEAFVIYRPTWQILWALVDGAGQEQIHVRIDGQDYALL
ncbi:MAG: hypothetical protein IAE87_04595 [Rhodobacteraceae bacterium]|nr:hypothetical protein [Paracoccaceae bacterium]